VHDLVTVTEAEIRVGLRCLAAERGYAAEGAGAAAIRYSIALITSVTGLR
jgi:threonine dehydratase